MKVNQTNGVIAIITAAIRENFLMQGPGWAPLKPSTIRQSLAKGLKKRAADAGSRMILQRTGMLKKSVTSMGENHNIFRTEGTKIVWGTDLLYAGIHNTGGIINHPGTKNGFGIQTKNKIIEAKNLKRKKQKPLRKEIIIPAHQIPIPKREYLVIKPNFINQIHEYMADTILKIIDKHLRKR